MNGNRLLDTNAVIRFLNDDPALIAIVRQTDELFVSVISLGELYFGANKSKRQRENRRRVNNFIKSSTVLDCNRETAAKYGDIRAQLMEKGKPIPHNDIWIAAAALQYDLSLVTRDAHFDEIDGLRIEAW